jgi:hypothetical protein
LTPKLPSATVRHMSRAAERLAIGASIALVAAFHSPPARSHQAAASELVLAEGEPTAPPARPHAELEVAAPLCPAVERPFGRCPIERDRLDIVTVFGARGSVTRVEGSDAVAGLLLGGEGLAYDTRGMATLRLAHFAYLGGGTGNLEGGIGLAYAMGAIAKLGDGHGPLARLGGRAHLHGNDELYASLVELPELQLGYQLLRRRLHVELAARAGAVLVGRYNPGAARRRLGKAFEWGALAALRWEAIHLDLEWMRIEARSSEPNTPVDVLSGMLCGAVNPLALCLDLRRYSGQARPNRGGAPLDLDATYIGLAIGAGSEL